MLFRVPTLFVRRTPVLRLPQVGEAVWWAPKQLGCQIRAITADGIVTYQGGEIVKNTKGRQVPRWTVMVRVEHMVYDPATKYWLVGRGPTPRVVRGTVLTPQPVRLSGTARGSFAPKGA